MEKYSTYEQLTPADKEILKNAQTFEELLEVALRVIKNLKKPVNPVQMVCGPITSGPKTVEQNIAAMTRAIYYLLDQGLHVFNQMPFEEPFHRIMKTPYYKNGNHLLEAFYLPIFESGLITGLIFLPNWKTSFGARWEHDQAKRLGLITYYLPPII